MRKTYDAEGNVTGTSKGMQGNVAGMFKLIFWAAVLLFCIAARVAG